MAEAVAWVFVNGPLAENPHLKEMIHPGDWLVAVDGGYRLLKAIGLKPELVIGDLDSISARELDEIQRGMIPIQRFPKHKDETDLELALNAVLGRGSRSIRIVGAQGGRLDQSLGNLFLLLRPELADLDVRMEDGETEAWLIRKEGWVKGQTGDVVSLLPVGNPVHGVTTYGLEYPLHSETLWTYRTRGISNVMESDEARIEILEGLLICVHIRKALQ